MKVNWAEVVQLVPCYKKPHKSFSTYTGQLYVDKVALVLALACHRSCIDEFLRKKQLSVIS